MACSNDEALVQLVAFEVERLLHAEEPRLDHAEIEESILCCLVHPLFLALNILGSGAKSLLLGANITSRPSELFNLRNGTPANLEAAVIRVNDVLLFEYKNAVDW